MPPRHPGIVFCQPAVFLQDFRWLAFFFRDIVLVLRETALHWPSRANEGMLYWRAGSENPASRHGFRRNRRPGRLRSSEHRGSMAAGLVAFFIALLSSLLLTEPVRALALRVGMVDLPGPRKVHLQPIPLLGGLAMYASVFLGVLFLFNGPARAQIAGILAGATLIAAVGILDDHGVLHHQVKLFVGMPLAAGILMLSGIRAQVFGTLVGGRTGDLLDI